MSSPLTPSSNTPPPHSPPHSPSDSPSDSSSESLPHSDTASEISEAAQSGPIERIAVTSHVGRHYVVRLSLMMLMFMGWGCWSLYDGFVKYPEQLRTYEAFEELKESDRISEWPALREANGWPETPKVRTERDVMTQHIQALLTFPLGLYFLIGLLRYMGRTVSTNEQGEVVASWGVTVRADQVTELNNMRWPTKGISMVTYESEGGGTKKIVLDNWKFEQHEMDVAIYQLQEQLSDDKIVGERIPVPMLLRDDEEEEASEETSENAGEDENGERVG